MSMFYYYFIRVLRFFYIPVIYIQHTFFPKKVIVEKVIEKNPIDIYIENGKTNFLDSYAKPIDFNSNIEAFLYDRPTLLELLKDEDNPIEPPWKRRILYESTPRGNIVMYYDVFKQGFAYYSDSTIHYSVLNVIAMKYCLTYYCRDFFSDEMEIPSGHSTPFIVTLKEEELNEFTKKKQHQQKISHDTKNSSFAKFKKYSGERPKETNVDLPSVTNKDALLIKNRFIYLGKIANFSFLGKIANKRVKRTPTSYDGMFGDVSTNRINYKLFKEKMAAGNHTVPVSSMDAVLQ